DLQELPVFHSLIHSCGRSRLRLRAGQRGGVVSSGLGDELPRAGCGKLCGEVLVYTAPSARFGPLSSGLSLRDWARRETHLPTKRAPSQAPTRVPRADEYSRGACEPQAPARQRAQASVCLRRAPKCIARAGFAASETWTR